MTTTIKPQYPDQEKKPSYPGQVTDKEPGNKDKNREDGYSFDDERRDFDKDKSNKADDARVAPNKNEAIEGEGSYTAGRRFNEANEQFTQSEKEKGGHFDKKTGPIERNTDTKKTGSSSEPRRGDAPGKSSKGGKHSPNEQHRHR